MPNTDPISSHLSRNCNSVERPRVLLDMFEKEETYNPPRFWRLVAEWWSSFDAVPYVRYGSAFRRNRSEWSRETAISDRAFYDALPETITVYRGQESERGFGLAWTIDRKVAEGFAFGARVWNRSPELLTARVRKSSVALVCTECKEQELVLFHPPRGLISSELMASRRA